MRNINIPENVMTNKRYLGFKGTNLKEAVIESIITFLILLPIPFVTKYRISIWAVISLGIFLANFIGLQGNSLFNALLEYIRYKKRIRTYHYRRFELNEKRIIAKPIKNGKVVTYGKRQTTQYLKGIFGL